LQAVIKIIIKKTIMKNIIFVVGLILISTTSCTKTGKTEEIVEKTQQIPSVLNYLTALSTPVDMQFNLSSSAPMLAFTNNTIIQNLRGTALNSNQEIVDIGPLSLNNVLINPVNNYYEKSFNALNNLYGQQLILKTSSVNAPLATGYQFSDTLYSPKELLINQSTINQDLAANKISPNKNLQWIADPNNITGGVIIVVEYIPQDPANTNLRQSNPTYVRNGIVVPDNGSANLDNSLFAGMPQNASLEVTLVRANYKKGVTNGLKSYMICAYSQKYMTFKYQQ
jgi:hypothetical protein